MKTVRWVMAAVAMLAAGAVQAADWYVNVNAPAGGNGKSWGAAYQQIQTALTAAAANDTVWVTNGTYGVISRTDNAKILVQSVNGPAVTSINGGGAQRCATLGGGTSHRAIVLSGLTLTNGAAISGHGGGAMYGTLTNCVLAGNSATASTSNGGGAYYSDLTDCTLSGNSAGGNGGGSAYGTLNNCTLSGNEAAVYGGGAMYGTLTGCTLSGNKATDYGGGTYSGTLTDCTLTGNEAEYGGGAYLGKLTGCTLTGNSASVYGGGAYNSALNNCVLTGNKSLATNAGGGGAAAGTLNNCILTGNEAVNSGGGAYGGTLNNCTVSGNKAGYGGGGANVATLNNCLITGNTANYGGGAGGGTLRNCTVWGNKATLSSGGVRGSAVVYNSIVWGNTNNSGVNNYDSAVTFTNCCTIPLLNPGTGNNTSADPMFVNAGGGDFHLNPGSPCVNTGDNAYIASGITTDLDGNPRSVGLAVDMGAYEIPRPIIYVSKIGRNREDGSTWSLAKQTIQNALTAAGAGEMVVVGDGTYNEHISRTDNADIIVQSVNGPYAAFINGNNTGRCATLGAATGQNNTTLVGFTLLDGNAVNGGGVAYGSLTNCVLFENYSSRDGGGAYRSRLIGCELVNNKAFWNGGGAAFGTLDNCYLELNSATDDLGGGGAYAATLTDCELVDNWANYNGGGTLECTLFNCTLMDNFSAESGGGASGGYLNNCLLIDNMAQRGAGADYSTLRNCTVTRNHAWGWSEGGGALNSKVYNSIVWGNTVSTGTHTNYYYTGNWGAFTNSCTAPLPVGYGVGTGNTASDPKFVNPNNGDFHLAVGSPCIGSGDIAYVSWETDLDGNPRIVSGKVDMGAYAYTPPSLTGLRITRITVGAAVYSSSTIPVTLAFEYDGSLGGDGIVVRRWFDLGGGDSTALHFPDDHLDGTAEITLYMDVNTPKAFFRLEVPR